MHIFVNTYSGKTITLHVKSSDVITSIKERLYYKEKIPSHYQRLVFEGFELINTHTLQDYNIKPNSTLHLNVKLQGGWEFGIAAAAQIAGTAVGMSSDQMSTTQKIAVWITNFVKNMADKKAKFLKENADRLLALQTAIFQFASFMRAMFQFFIIIILARIVVGFFSKPLEFIMLGISMVFLSVIYVIYYIFYIPPFIWVPFLIWFTLFDLLPWLIYVVVMMVLFLVITLFILILAFINACTGGSLKSLVLCQNHVASWYKTPNYHLTNKYERGFLCSRQCYTGYAPDPTGMYCIKIPKGSPSYCPQSEVMRMYTTNRNDHKYYYKDYNIRGNMKYMTSSPMEREMLLKDHYLKKRDFMDKCENSLGGYTIPLNICSSLDTIEANKVNGIDKKTIEKMKKVCQQAYCNSKSNYPFCSQLSGGDDEEEGAFFKKVCRILISIAVFMFIIIFILNYMSRNIMD